MDDVGSKYGLPSIVAVWPILNFNWENETFSINKCAYCTRDWQNGTR